MRTNPLCLLALAATGLAAGCGGPTIERKPPPNVVPGPHGGPAYLLPEGLGYVEIANDPPVDARAEDETSLVVCFLKPDAKSSLTPDPTDVDVRVWHREKFRKVHLEASPLSGDPAGGCRFVSPPGPFALSAIRGSVTALIGGRRVSKEVAGMR